METSREDESPSRCGPAGEGYHEWPAASRLATCDSRRTRRQRRQDRIDERKQVRHPNRPRAKHDHAEGPVLETVLELKVGVRPDERVELTCSPAEELAAHASSRRRGLVVTTAASTSDVSGPAAMDQRCDRSRSRFFRTHGRFSYRNPANQRNMEVRGAKPDTCPSSRNVRTVRLTDCERAGVRGVTKRFASHAHRRRFHASDFAVVPG